jgi:hypothetical protein
MVAAAKAAKVSLNLRVTTGLQRNETDRECAVACEPFHRLVRIRLSRERLAQQA